MPGPRLYPIPEHRRIWIHLLFTQKIAVPLPCLIVIDRPSEGTEIEQSAHGWGALG